MSRYSKLELVYSIISLVSLFFLVTKNELGFYITKPLIVPILLIYLFHKFNETQHQLIPALMVATIFSFLGDIFLLFTINEELFKLVGICTFIVAQTSYAYLYFLSVNSFPKKKISFLARWPEFLSSVVILGATIILYPSLGNFAAPAIIYSFITSITIIFALNRRFYVSRKSFVLTFLGVISFFISDALMGDDIFLENILNHFFIMLSYLIGHFLIIKGILFQIESTKKKDTFSDVLSFS
ncbi:putative membrane protein [Belliella baltica DSM 15883]|uniref:Putative membrane protein n=1 Tax=Belliella baltica (strain DSM 15883 / CIP 108006 / LMG 21964 / BA134) TaxID=866536 RepID=I3Z6W0_BELBD|nr:lysoplasmalogenase [Belliella baltica]AFL84978.1 putative membrane protein [Belliella baltica DSM 15883]